MELRKEVVEIVEEVLELGMEMKLVFNEDESGDGEERNWERERWRRMLGSQQQWSASEAAEETERGRPTMGEKESG